MDQSQKNTYTSNVDGVKVSVSVDGLPNDSSHKRKQEKASDFIKWCDHPDQTALDLSAQPQVMLRENTIRVDKPTGKEITFGVVSSGVSKADQETIWRLFETGKKVHIIVREVK